MYRMRCAIALCCLLCARNELLRKMDVNNIVARSSNEHNFTFKNLEIEISMNLLRTICNQPFCVAGHLTDCGASECNQKNCALTFCVRPEEVDYVVIVKGEAGGTEFLRVRRKI